MGWRGRMSRLTDKKIKSITTPGREPDGNNLYLNVSRSLRKSWTCRVRVSGGCVRDIGLGAYPAVSLKEARQKRDAVALDAANGRDPLSERKAAEAEKARLPWKATWSTFCLPRSSRWHTTLPFSMKRCRLSGINWKEFRPSLQTRCDS